MSQLSSPLPYAPQALVAASPPQTTALNATRAGDQGNVTSFADQLGTLLEVLAQTEQTTATMMTAAAAGDQPASSATVVSAPLEADATIPDATATDTAPTAPPEPLLIATALQAPDASPVRPRDAESGKPKAEPATSARRASVASSRWGAPAVGLVPPPDSAAASLQSVFLVTPSVEPRHNSAPHQGNDQADPSGAAGALSLAPSPSLKPEELKPAVKEPQLPEVAPVHLSPSSQEANALQTASLADPFQPAPQPVRAAQLQAATSSTGQHMSPTAQLTPALMQLGHAPDGAQRLTVRLDPPELGQVQIKIDRPSDAAARVEITVEKPETLSMLLRDQPQLQRALDQAGVPVEGRNVTFHVAAPEPPSRSDSGTAPVPNTNAGGLTGDGSHGAARQDTRSGRRSPDSPDDDGAQFTPITGSRWMRAGLDITA